GVRPIGGLAGQAAPGVEVPVLYRRPPHEHVGSDGPPGGHRASARRGRAVIRLRRGYVVRIVRERPGAVELEVDVDGATERALAYPALCGPVAPGARVLLNTTAVRLGLGTGGLHFVVSVDGGDAPLDAEGPGHTMKLRYTPQQVKVLAIEEPESPYRAAM